MIVMITTNPITSSELSRRNGGELLHDGAPGRGGVSDEARDNKSRNRKEPNPLVEEDKESK